MSPENMPSADFASWSVRSDLERVIGPAATPAVVEVLDALEAVEVLAELLHVHELEALGDGVDFVLSSRQRCAVLTAVRALAARREVLEAAVSRQLGLLDASPPEGRKR